MSGPSRPQPRWSRFHPQGAPQPLRIDPARPEAAAGEEAAPAAPAEPADTIPAPGETPHEAPAADAPAGNGQAPAGGPLPRAFQLRHVYTEPTRQRGTREVVGLVLGGLLLLAVGAAAGYFAVGAGLVPSRTAAAPTPPAGGLTLALGDTTQATLDDAFAASKDRSYPEARAQFATLYKEHPEWPSMAVESARAALYQKDAGAAMGILDALPHGDALPDVELLQALAYLMHKEFGTANQRFATAAALDPARPDVYYFWGECLRGEGKPREAAEKFRAALLRNQYETAEGLFQLKLWLSQIQSDQEETSGANAKIDAALATKPRPPYSALFAAAARAMKAGGYKDAADWIAKGQQSAEPAVFRVILQDPTFRQESWRPELKGFYR